MTKILEYLSGSLQSQKGQNPVHQRRFVLTWPAGPHQCAGRTTERDEKGPILAYMRLRGIIVVQETFLN